MANKSIRATIAICAIALPLIGVFVLQMNRYYEREYLRGIKAIWNSDELFVFLQVNIIVEKTPTWNILLAKFFGLWVPSEGSTKKDLRVFHLRGQSLAEHRQENFDSAGQIVPINGVPHLLQGGTEITGFKWEETHFVKIGADNLKQIELLLSSDTDLLRRTGWRKLDWEEIGNLNRECDKSFPFDLRETKASMQIKVTPPSYDIEGYVARDPSVRVDLLINTSQRNLLDMDQNHKRISRQDFQKIVSQVPITKK